MRCLNVKRSSKVTTYEVVLKEPTKWFHDHWKISLAGEKTYKPLVDIEKLEDKYPTFYMIVLTSRRYIEDNYGTDTLFINFSSLFSLRTKNIFSAICMFSEGWEGFD